MSIEGTANTEYASLSGKIRTFVVDKTLTISGACADAKATGEAIDAKAGEAAREAVNKQIGPAVAEEVAKKAISKSGDTMTGNLTFAGQSTPQILMQKTNGQGEGIIYPGANNMCMTTRNTEGNDNIKRSLYLYNSAMHGLDKCLRVYDVLDGVGTWYEVLHTGNLEALGSCRIVSGEVTGNDKAGEDSPNSITFPFKPKLVYVTRTGRDMSQSVPDMRFGHFLWTEGVAYDQIAQTGDVERRYKLDGNTLSWWVSDAAYSAAVVGRYVAIG